jgi:hypothetical protein
MRALVALLLAFALVATAAIPHVHVHATGGDECAVCVLRHTAPPRSEIPDVKPIVSLEGEAQPAPGVAPVCGAPLGAIPGQSPPAGA